MGEKESKNIAKNRKAFHDYFIEETLEAGIELTGTEVRSLRENSCQLKDCFVLIKKGEAWLYNVHISPYSHGNRANVDPDRKRRLLLHRKQIIDLSHKTAERGFSLIPLSFYFNSRGLVKVELALARGKKLYDKRDSIAKKDAQRDIDRAMKERYR
jgi:SsrA-binding protein